MKYLQCPFWGSSSSLCRTRSSPSHWTKPNWVQAGQEWVPPDLSVSHLMTGQGSVKAVLTTVGQGGCHLFLCSLKEQGNALCFLLLCEATKDESETEDSSGLVGLDLLLKTSGELTLGISWRAEGPYVVSGICPSLRASRKLNVSFTFCLPDDTSIPQPQLKPPVDLCFYSPLTEKNKTKEFILWFSNTGETDFYFTGLRQSHHLLIKCWKLNRFSSSIQEPNL